MIDRRTIDREGLLKEYPSEEGWLRLFVDGSERQDLGTTTTTTNGGTNESVDCPIEKVYGVGVVVDSGASVPKKFKPGHYESEFKCGSTTIEWLSILHALQFAEWSALLAEQRPIRTSKGFR